MDSLAGIKEEILHVCRRIYAREMVASNDGNVSARLGSDRVVCTPNGMSKGFLEADDLAVLDLSGNPAGDNRRTPTSETPMHLGIYRMRPDISAIVHAHPITATAYAVAGRTVDHRALPESFLTLGSVPLVPYGAPSTEELPEQIGKFIRDHNVFLLANHGALALGGTVLEAYHRIECLEHTAKILFHAEALGGVIKLTSGQRARLTEIFG
ncbi:MAG: class II aldolase/adducin family protein [Gemmatimonadota bacterium]|nr:class II aldolase/adducin family protein [Gemmatimonadota bacterium]